MTAVDSRMFRPEAVAIAKALIEQIDDCCERLVVGGSLRRRLGMIGDIEIVCVPKIELDGGDLFGDRPVGVNLLDARVQDLLEHGEVDRRLDKHGVPRWGSALKYLTYRGARVDLFAPDAERFGWILMLRTGPATFSRQLVVPRGQRTKDNRPGLLPGTILPKDGWLTRRVSGEKLATPDEEDAFTVLKLAYIPPWERI